MLNVAALNGRLTADPELRHTNSDIAVTSFTLAVDRNFQKQGEERQTDFIDIVCWRGTAEFASKCFHKGQLVAVEGSIETGTYTDKDGNKRRSFKVRANNVFFAERKRDTNESSGTPNKSSGSSENKGSSAPALSGGANDDDFMTLPDDDTLPF